MNSENVLQILSNIELFKSLTENEIKVVCDGLELYEYPADKVLMKQGNMGDAMIVLVSGKVRVIRETQSGDKIELGVLGPKSVLGEISLLLGEPRSATVVAASSTVSLVIPRKVFASLLEQRPEIGNELIRIITDRKAEITVEETRSMSEMQKKLNDNFIDQMKDSLNAELGPEITGSDDN